MYSAEGTRMVSGPPLLSLQSYALKKFFCLFTQDVFFSAYSPLLLSELRAWNELCVTLLPLHNNPALSLASPPLLSSHSDSEPTGTCNPGREAYRQYPSGLPVADVDGGAVLLDQKHGVEASIGLSVHTCERGSAAVSPPGGCV